jgi:hypothetical protein
MSAPVRVASSEGAASGTVGLAGQFAPSNLGSASWGVPNSPPPRCARCRLLPQPVREAT